MKRPNVYECLKTSLSGKKIRDVQISSSAEGSITCSFEVQELFIQDILSSLNTLVQDRSLGNYDLLYCYKQNTNTFKFTCRESFYEIYSRAGEYKGVSSKDYNEPVIIESQVSDSTEAKYSLRDINNKSLIPAESIISVRETFKNKSDSTSRLRNIVDKSRDINYVVLFNSRTFKLERHSPRVLKTLKEFGFKIYVTSWEYILDSSGVDTSKWQKIDRLGKDIFDDNFCEIKESEDDDAYLPTLYFDNIYTPVIIEDLIERSTNGNLIGSTREMAKFSAMFGSWDMVYYHLNYSYIDTDFAILVYMLENTQLDNTCSYKYRVCGYKKGTVDPIFIKDVVETKKSGTDWMPNNLHYVVKGTNNISVIKDMLRFSMSVVREANGKYIITLPSIDILRDTISNRVYKSNDINCRVDFTGSDYVKQVTKEEIQKSALKADIKNSITKTVELTQLGMVDLLKWVVEEGKISKEDVSNTRVIKDYFNKEKLQGKLMIKFPKRSNTKDLKTLLTQRSSIKFSIADKGKETILRFEGYRESTNSKDIGSLKDLLEKEGVTL